MQVQATSHTVNEVKYVSENARLTAEDFQAIAKDMKSRKIPGDARIVMGTAISISVRF